MCRGPADRSSGLVASYRIIAHTKEVYIIMASKPKPWERAAITPQTSTSGATSSDATANEGVLPESTTATTTAASAAADKRDEEDVIKKAVRFLTLASVRDRPLEAKRAFLESKGLTPSQIDEAVKEAALMAPPTPRRVARASAAVAATASASTSAPSASLSKQAARTDSALRPMLLGGFIGTLAGGALALAAAASRGDSLDSLRRWLRGGESRTPTEAGSPLQPLRLPLKAPPSDAEDDSSATSTPAPAKEVGAASLLSPSLSPPALATGPLPLPQVPSRTEAALGALRVMREESRIRTSQRLEEGEAEGARRAEAVLSALRTAVGEMIRCCESNAGGSSCGDGAKSSSSSAAASSTAASAIHTLVMCLGAQLKHPKESRYHRLNLQNANLARLIALPGADAVLHALSFEEDEQASGFRTWRGGNGNKLPTARELKMISAQRDELMKTQRALSGS